MAYGRCAAEEQSFGTLVNLVSGTLISSSGIPRTRAAHRGRLAWRQKL